MGIEGKIEGIEGKVINKTEEKNGTGSCRKFGGKIAGRPAKNMGKWVMNRQRRIICFLVKGLDRVVLF